MRVGRSMWREPLIGVFVVAATLTTVWISVLAYGAAQLGPTSVPAFVEDYDQRLLDDGLELLIVQSDGQAFATLARDPLLRRPESFPTDAEASYRAQRPLLPWLATLLSLGRSGWVPPAMAIVAVAGTGAAAAGIGALLRARGRPVWLGLAVLALPGVGSALSYLGPEPLVLALLAWGVWAWERDRIGTAVLLFVLAALGRETAILVPFVLGVAALSGRRWRRAWALLTVPAAMLAWDAVLRLRIGAWPWEADDNRLGPPFVGFTRAVSELWPDPAREWMFVSLAVLVVAGTVTLGRRDLLTPIVVVHALFGTLLGKLVWAKVDFHARVLLPMYAFGLVAIIAGSTIGRRTSAPETTGSPSGAPVEAGTG